MGLTDDLISRCEDRYKDTANDLLTAAQWLAYLNDTYDEINGTSAWWPWKELRSTSVTISSGANSATLPTDAWSVTAVWNATDEYPLSPLSGHSDYRWQFPLGGSDLSSPVSYRLRSNTLEVYPYADHAVTLHVDYAAVPALLDDDPDSDPILPRQFNQALVEGALARAYMDDGNMDWARSHREIMGGIVENMARDLLGPREETYPRIVDDF